MGFDFKIFLASFFVWVVSYNAWQLLGVNIYYVGQASIILGCAWLIFKQNKHSDNKISVVITEIFLLFSINNMADELFFDPTRVSINEFIFVFGYTALKLYKTWKNTKHTST